MKLAVLFTFGLAAVSSAFDDLLNKDGVTLEDINSYLQQDDVVDVSDSVEVEPIPVVNVLRRRSKSSKPKKRRTITDNPFEDVEMDDTMFDDFDLTDIEADFDGAESVGPVLDAADDDDDAAVDLDALKGTDDQLIDDKTLDIVAEKKAAMDFGFDSDSDIPDSLLCGVCFDLLTEPMLTSDGRTYCRQCLERFKNKDPILRRKIPRKDRTVNKAIDEMTEAYRRDKSAATQFAEAHKCCVCSNAMNDPRISIPFGNSFCEDCLRNSKGRDPRQGAKPRNVVPNVNLRMSFEEIKLTILKNKQTPATEKPATDPQSNLN